MPQEKYENPNPHYNPNPSYTIFLLPFCGILSRPSQIIWQLIMPRGWFSVDIKPIQIPDICRQRTNQIE